MISEDDNVVVVDVRGNIDYCYTGHIPCALNLDWNSGQFEREYQQLPLNVAIINICEHGNRGRYASDFLDQHGYNKVYNVSGGMSVWPYEKVTCKNENPDDCIKQKNQLYFPHIASDNGWKTEIAIINTSSKTSLSGTLKGYNNAGKQVDELKIIDLKARSRYEIKISDIFPDPELISYLIFTYDSDQACGYLKFYDSSNASYRVAIPAPDTVNHDDIIISHIAVSDGWWTSLNLVNTTAESRTLTFTFNNDPTKVKTLTLAAGAHQAKDLAKFLDGWQLDDIESAVISNAEGIVGLELFGNGKQLSGILLRDKTAETLYYPHIASDKTWWTGVIAFNAGTSSGILTIKPYAEDGSPLSTAEMETFDIGAQERFVRAVSQLNLPAETAWLAIESTVPISGFELFGTSDNLQLAGYTCVGIDGMSGVFPKLDKSGWSGIALVNTTSGKISVTLRAYSDDGKEVDKKTLPLTGFQKIVDEPKDIFDNELDSATYITYKATAPVAAFQLNGDGEMLDALPGR